MQKLADQGFYPRRVWKPFVVTFIRFEKQGLEGLESLKKYQFNKEKKFKEI